MATSQSASAPGAGSAADALRAGVVGLGTVGAGLAVSLSRSGRIPSVFDIRPDAYDGLKTVAHPEPSAAELARNCDVVLITVFDEEQVRQALTAPDGILAGAHPGLIAVVLSTVSVAAVHEFGRLCDARNVALLDCGITPGDQVAVNGVVGLLGGPDDILTRALPVLNDFARVIVHCGPLGAGMTVKIARNLFTYCAWAAADEAARLAEASGIGSDTFIAALRETDEKFPQFLRILELRTSGIDLPPERVGNATQVAAKDLDWAAQLGLAHRVPIPLAEAARPLMRDVFARNTVTRKRQ